MSRDVGPLLLEYAARLERAGWRQIPGDFEPVEADVAHLRSMAATFIAGEALGSEDQAFLRRHAGQLRQVFERVAADPAARLKDRQNAQWAIGVAARVEAGQGGGPEEGPS